jgi:hypothetical protein
MQRVFKSRGAVAILGFVLAGLCAASVAANGIASDLGRLPVGTTIVWRNSEGPVFTHVVRGKDRRGLARYAGGAESGQGSGPDRWPHSPLRLVSKRRPTAVRGAKPCQ